MEVTLQSRLRFLGVNILTVDYSIKQNIGNDKIFDFAVDPKVYFPDKDQKAFNILMTIELKYKDDFRLFIQSSGNFIVESDEIEDQRAQFINANAPAIMFPYIRAFVSTFTANIGNLMGPIILPPHFFSGNIEEYKVIEERAEA